jgi:hypothetical protein
MRILSSIFSKVSLLCLIYFLMQVAYSGENVKNHGVIGDGITDDTNAIQYVLDNYNDVYFPNGVYLVKKLYYNSFQIMTGQSRGGVVIKLIGPVVSEHQQVLTPKNWKTTLTEDVTIQTLTINGNRDGIDWSGISGDGAAHGISIWGVQNTTIQNVTIQNCWTDGIYVHATHSSAGNQYNAEDIIIDNVLVENCGRQGISVISGERGEISNCTIRDINRTSPKAAIDLEPNPGQLHPLKTWSISYVEVLRCNSVLLVSDVGLGNMSGIVAKEVRGRELNGIGFSASYNAKVELDGVRIYGGAGIGAYITQNAEVDVTGVLVLSDVPAGIKVDSTAVLAANYPNSYVYVQYINGGASLNFRDYAVVNIDHMRLLGLDTTSTPVCSVTSPNVTLNHMLVYGPAIPTYLFDLVQNVYCSNSTLYTTVLGIKKPWNPGNVIGSGNSW